MRAASNETGNVAEIEAFYGRLDVKPYVVQEGSQAALLFAQGVGKLEKAGWDEVCNAGEASSEPWWDEVFRDGKGAM